MYAKEKEYELMGQLDKTTVIITGAAQGIGAAYARGLAAEGCNVIVNDVLDPAPLVSEIKAAGGEARANRGRPAHRLHSRRSPRQCGF